MTASDWTRADRIDLLERLGFYDFRARTGARANEGVDEPDDDGRSETKD